ncbi:hypothetical protein AVEN_64979-1, partial [Araneus ventricosus]
MAPYFGCSTYGTLCQLFLQNESAYSAVSNLGELGLVQFRD